MLSSLWPDPVPVPIAGRTWLVSQYQIRDLVALEQMAVTGIEAFWLDLATTESLPDQAVRHDGLRTLYDRAEKGMPGFGSTEVSESLDTPEGRLEGLFRSLRKAPENQIRHRSDVIGVAQSMVGTDWDTVGRIAWSADPLDEVARSIDREIGVSLPPGESSSHYWNRAVCLAIKRTGWTLDQIADLYLSQWYAVLGWGRKATHPVAEPEGPPKGWSWQRLDHEVMRPRAAFWATSEAIPTPIAAPSSVPSPDR